MVPKQQFFIAFGLHESTHDGTSCIRAYLKGPCDTFLSYRRMVLLLGPLASRLSCHISFVGVTVLEATHLEGEMGWDRGGEGLICGPIDGPHAMALSISGSDVRGADRAIYTTRHVGFEI